MLVDRTIIGVSAKGQKVVLAHEICSDALCTTLVHACSDVLEDTRERLSSLVPRIDRLSGQRTHGRLFDVEVVGAVLG